MLAVGASLHEQLDALVESCVDCANACAASIDAFAESELSDRFRHCTLASAECAALCNTTAQAASQYFGNRRAFVALLRACAAACEECAAECARHQIAAAARCARAGRDCKRACERVANALRWRNALALIPYMHG